MLTIIHTLNEWRHFLEGAQHLVEIWTDHKNLEYFMMAKKLNHCQAHWSLYLVCFDFKLIVRDVRSRSGVTRNGAELLWNGRDLTTKVGEQPWPQLMRCASIYCRVCGCVFQEDWIVARSLGEEWYRLIGVRVGQGEDVNDFNLQTKELGCNYWSTYTKSGIGGVQVTSLHCDPIGVDNRSSGAKN